MREIETTIGSFRAACWPALPAGAEPGRALRPGERAALRATVVDGLRGTCTDAMLTRLGPNQAGRVVWRAGDANRRGGWESWRSHHLAERPLRFVKRLPDGRVVVRCTTTFARDGSDLVYDDYFMLKVDGRWLIDAVAHWGV